MYTKLRSRRQRLFSLHSDYCKECIQPTFSQIPFSVKFPAKKEKQLKVRKFSFVFPVLQCKPKSHIFYIEQQQMEVKRPNSTSSQKILALELLLILHKARALNIIRLQIECNTYLSTIKNSKFCLDLGTQKNRDAKFIEK